MVELQSNPAHVGYLWSTGGVAVIESSPTWCRAMSWFLRLHRRGQDHIGPRDTPKAQNFVRNQELKSRDS
jgi:hypothetical protein